jgi:hypothetical protein
MLVRPAPSDGEKEVIPAHRHGCITVSSQLRRIGTEWNQKFHEVPAIEH